MADDWSFMKAADAISGKEGTLYATIDGNVVQVAECKSISVKIDKNKSSFKSLGQRGEQSKATGWKGTGSLTVYYATSLFSKMMIDYADSGVDTYFTLTITNDDPTSSVGKQVVVISDVNMDNSEVAKLDTEAEILDQQMNFTFSGIKLLTPFNGINKQTNS